MSFRTRPVPPAKQPNFTLHHQERKSQVLLRIPTFRFTNLAASFRLIPSPDHRDTTGNTSSDNYKLHKGNTFSKPRGNTNTTSSVSNGRSLSFGLLLMQS